MQTALQVAANEVWTGLQGIAKVTQFGIEVREQIDLDDFRKAFGLLLFLDSRYKVFINFALGDLYNALDMKHGEKKSQIVDTWGIGWYHRLSALGGVASRITKLCRHNFQLEWHVYESFALKSIPQDVRETGLQAAADMKAKGQYVTRETLRHSVDPYRQPKAAAGPQWSGGGKFGESAEEIAYREQVTEGRDSSERGADEAEKPAEEVAAALPKRETKPLEPDTQSPFEAHVDEPVSVHAQTLVDELVSTLESHVDETSEDISDLIPREGLVVSEEQDSRACPVCGEVEIYCCCDDCANKLIRLGDWRSMVSSITERAETAETLQAENTSLKAKLAGAVLAIPYDLEEMIKLELGFRRKREPGDATLDFDSIALLALRRGLKTLAADHGRKR